MICFSVRAVPMIRSKVLKNSRFVSNKVSTFSSTASPLTSGLSSRSRETVHLARDWPTEEFSRKKLKEVLVIDLFRDYRLYLYSLDPDILFGNDITIHNSKRTNSREHQTFEDLCPKASPVDQADMRRFQHRLAMITPESVRKS